MQQPSSMVPAMPSFPPTNITTDQIEKCLEENKKLILAILDNQNLGKLAECAQYQAQLQKNLMYLAAIADAQPQMSMIPAQMSSAPHPGMQQGAYYMHPQAAAMAQQNPTLFPSKMNMQFASPHQTQQEQHQQHQQQQQQQQQHQQAMQGQMNILGGGSGMHSEAPGQNKLDAPRSSAVGHNGGGDPSN